MKKYVLAALVVCFALTFSSCASKKAMDTSKAYLDEYYQNLSQSRSTQCFYQLNKNSVDQIEQAFGLGAEDYLSVRSLILGSVKSHEILEESYTKDGDNKYVDLKVKVEYEKATVDEKVQIIIKKDGQISINSIEFGSDSVLNNTKEKYLGALKTNTANVVIECMAPHYFERKTKRNVEDMITQASELGGKLSGSSIIEGRYIYEPVDSGAFVYEVLVKMNYEETTMLNKIKIISQDGQLGIGYSVISPEKIFLFFDQYQSLLNESKQEDVINLYSDDFFGDSQESRDIWWQRLQKYSEEYGSLTGFDVISMGLDQIKDAKGEEVEVLRVDLNIQYENKDVKNTFILLNEEAYKIYDHYFSDD